MNTEYSIHSVEKITDPMWEAIGGGINQFNSQQAGDCREMPLCYLLQAADAEIAGGIIAFTYWEWCYISLMWIKAELRGQGYGQQMLALAEEEARQRGVKNVYLDTFSFQAPEFYKKYGYRIFGELKDFPPGHQRYFMTKAL